MVGPSIAGVELAAGLGVALPLGLGVALGTGEGVALGVGVTPGDAVGCAECVGVAVALALATGLTAYDASYLWLTRKLGAELVTLDQQLARADMHAAALKHGFP